MIAEFAYKSHTVHVTMHDLRPSTKAAPADDAERTAYAQEVATTDPPTQRRNPHECLPDYVKAQPISTVAMGTSGAQGSKLSSLGLRCPTPDPHQTPSAPITVGGTSSFGGRQQTWQDDIVSC